MLDRAQQALYLQALDPVAECLADPNSYGFRRYRSTADALEQCFNLLARGNSPQWILEGDIAACFDCIDHDWLLAHIPLSRSPLAAWLKAGYLERHIVHPTREGTPQGGILSPVLANLALDGLEARLAAAFPQRARRPSALVHVVRYADDFIVTGRSQELLEHEVRPVVEEFLRERGLRLSPEKTVITHVRDGFDFLGQNVRKYGSQPSEPNSGKLLLKPAAQNVRAFLKGVREFVKNHKQTTAGHLIGVLNPKITGWANHHRHAASKRTFQKVDHQLFQLLWWWAKRRHPEKTRQWVRERYFTTVGGNQWVFYATERDRHGEVRTLHLQQANATRIRRHIKVRNQLNPYDPAWQEYCEQRKQRLHRERPTDGSRDNWNQEMWALFHQRTGNEEPKHERDRVPHGALPLA